MPDTDQTLITLIADNEQFLMECILAYAKKCDYTKYTSTLIEAWRISIQGLSTAFIEALESELGVPDLTPDEEFRDDPMATFGMTSARKHRQRGVSYPQFMGLMKYYRQSYLDLIYSSNFDFETEHSYQYTIDRFFDRIELAFSTEWLSLTEDNKLDELRDKTRLLTNEKNRYLTIFESQRDPIIFVNHDGKIENMNYAAQMLFSTNITPGKSYYSDHLKGIELPWFCDNILSVTSPKDLNTDFEQEIETAKGNRHYHIRVHRMLDESKKFTGSVVMLTDITLRKLLEIEKEKLIKKLETSLEEIKTLQGIVPICSYCKKIRDTEGYWSQVETYISKHTGAQFSHGICEQCLGKYFPEHQDESPPEK